MTTSPHNPHASSSEGAPPVAANDPPGADVPSSAAVPQAEDDDTHPTDPSRTRSGRFKNDFVHNAAGRRGRRARKGEPDLATVLRSIAHELIEAPHPVTGQRLTVIEGLARSVIQLAFKDPRVGLAALQLLTQSGAVPMTAPDIARSPEADAATLAEFEARVRRQARVRADTRGGLSEDAGATEGEG